jgi:hypothetical protein
MCDRVTYEKASISQVKIYRGRYVHSALGLYYSGELETYWLPLFAIE